MNRSGRIAGMPYGAYELKATYQRSMLLGTLSTIIMTTMIIGGLHLYLLYSPERIIIEARTPPIIGGISQPSPPPSVERDKPNISGKRRPAVINSEIHNRPVLVDDSLLLEVEDNNLSTNAEIGEFLNGVYGAGGGDTGEGDRTFNYCGNGTVPEYPLIDSVFFVEQLPVMIYEEPPDYPRPARMAGIEGMVWIKALVDKNGNVIEAVVFKSSGTRAGLDEAARQAAFECKYKPAIQNGYPVPVWVTYKVEFRLRDSR
nr:energy transducer TonB [candidate division Zixibacteria bacterium]